MEYTGYIANKINQIEEADINEDEFLKSSTFIISGLNGEPFEIPLESEKEFRRLVLSIKPLHTVALLNGTFPTEIVNDGLPYSLPFNLV